MKRINYHYDSDFIVKTDDEEDEDDEEDDEDEEEEYEEEDDEEYKKNIKKKILQVLIDNIDSSSSNDNTRKRKIADNGNEYENKRRKYDDIIKNYSEEEIEFFHKLKSNEQEELYNIEKNLKAYSNDLIEPSRFKFLKLDMKIMTKKIILSKIEQLNKLKESNSDEYYKLNNWISTLSNVPLGKFNTLNSIDNISLYLQNIKKSFDDNIFGHNEIKEQLIRILAQWISNPSSGGYVIGIQGPPGVGKTKLVKDGICKALGTPLSFISLGGISDASYLNGHNYTYEGSTYGKIIESLIKANIMNPVFLFDELDKVSQTLKGDEIVNTLIHLTDPEQNDRYCDKYFEEVELDLSKSLIIFTYNNEELINPILKDRMITINVKGYNENDKYTLCTKYIIPEILQKYNMIKEDIIFEEELLKHIINEDKGKEGVRNIKRIINDIISWVNMMKYIPTDDIKIDFPYTVNLKYYDKYCKKIQKNNDILISMYL